MRCRHLYVWALMAAMVLLPCHRVWAAFGEDIEAPKPKFSQEGADWIATLVPRGKSTEIKIRFRVTGGTFTAVDAKVFAPGDLPQVDQKTFRSDFFRLQMTPAAQGGEVSLAMNSDYFTTATELWGAVSVNSPVWQTTGAVNVKNADRGNTLTLTVRDGGPLDADGQADGRIQLICGPRDSFWGYALGTLFIRFFGVFVVLGVLEVGMLVSGRIFQRIAARAQPPAAQSPTEEPPMEETHAVTPETAAAIALALHLKAGAGGLKPSARTDVSGGSPWAQLGRAKSMSDRMPVFDRPKRK